MTDKQSRQAPHHRAELRAALEFLQPGDTLVVPALDRLSRSLQDLITTVADLRRLGVGFTSLHEVLDTTTPAGGWCSTSSLRWPSSSASSSSPGPPRA
jgi:DNA invertase Pin-like site-specific DNA recombinase